MAYFFFSFFLRDLLLRMLPIGAEMGNMPLSSTLDMSGMYSSGSMGVSESKPIANVSTISLTSSSMLSVDVPMSLVILSILTPWARRDRHGHACDDGGFVDDLTHDEYRFAAHAIDPDGNSLDPRWRNYRHRCIQPMMYCFLCFAA